MTVAVLVRVSAFGSPASYEQRRVPPASSVNGKETSLPSTAQVTAAAMPLPPSLIESVTLVIVASCLGSVFGFLTVMVPATAKSLSVSLAVTATS